MDATPFWPYESYSPSLSPFGGEAADEPERDFPFGFAPTPVKPLADYWDDCGVVD